ncbi:hypothetical protein GOP47_0007992 [Adiantum capillus-veneris]|uniref:Pentatricopeptide repeat-containing protein n=1 Tax=Adiantum capillus-veneris TaxID=13818 RepID=A0A9D4V2P2_ADICA|nr:hypothetical protein GOP47_0007992 [Adiantum capillus-veneris]
MGCQSLQRLGSPPCLSAVLRKLASSFESKVQAYDPGFYQRYLRLYCSLHHELCCHGDSSAILHSGHDVFGDKQSLRKHCEAGHIFQAVDLLSQIKVPIHISNYVLLLKACIAYKAPSIARQVYAHVVQYSSGVTPLLADYLVVTFAKCGANDDASQLFNALSHRTVLSWTALIAAYTDCGYAEDALQMFQFMQEDGVEPDSYTFVSLFKACGIITNLEEGMRLHVIAQEKGLTSNVFVGNTLLSMYTKCEDALQAEEVFRGLLRRSVVSWNGMLSVLLKVGPVENVLLSYRQLCEELKDPDPMSLVFALQACGILADMPVKDKKLDKITCLEIGLALHSFARTRSYESNLFVGTALINMYGKCGAIKDAQHVFETLSQRDLVFWNTLVLAFLQEKQEEKALQLYTLIKKEGLSPDDSTFILLFKACGNLADFVDAFIFEDAKLLHIAQALHLDASKQGLEDTLAVGNSLVMMYGKLGAIMEAECLFSVMEERDVVSWSIMLSLYVDQGRANEGLLLYRQMQEEAVTPDQHVLVSALRACAALSQEEQPHYAIKDPNKRLFYEMGLALLADAYRTGLCLDSYVGNVLINMYSKCVGVLEAENVFLSLSDRDVVAWTTMLSAYIEHGQARKALQLYVLMHEECVAPNGPMFVAILHGCSALVDCEKDLSIKESSWNFMMLEIVQALHTDANRVGLTTDTSVRIAFVTAYGKCANVLEAENLFVTTSSLDIRIRNALFSVYLEHGLGEKSLSLFKEMQKEHPVIDEVGLIWLLLACTDSVNLETCRELHFYLLAGGYGKSIFLASSLVQTYASCASIEDMQAAFNEVVGPDTVCWTACIGGNAGFGNFILSTDIFERSKLAGVKPDEVVLTALLSSCANSGRIAEGLEYFISLREDYGVMLHLKHYGTVLTLLGGVGSLRRAENILIRMPLETDFTIWSSLLRACHTHCNVEFARKLFTQALHKEQVEAPMYVLLSNICCSDRKGGEAATEEHFGIYL